MKISEFLTELRPTTLAAVVVDCEESRDGHMTAFGMLAQRQLETLVGVDEAQTMIEDEAGGLPMEMA